MNHCAGLNVNQRSEETESATMRHPEGEQPVMFVLPQIKIAPGPLERLQASRAAFVALHASLRELAVLYAHTQSSSFSPSRTRCI